MRSIFLGLLLLPAAAAAGVPDPPVVGGTSAPRGAWPDAAAVLYQDSSGRDAQGCSGTLIAPTVVITAGHCNDPRLGTLDHVLVGATSLAHPDDGELLPVRASISYPGWASSVDVTVLVLGKAAREPPRPIATGWARLDIVDGAPVELVGFGAIDPDGFDYVDDLQQAETTITDAGCTDMPGCHPDAQPDGELGAGGMGVDTCFGDSGGPMYLLAGGDALLAGVTSRAYQGATLPCSQGGIYERPDKIVDWIEAVAGVPVARGPEPTFEPIETVAGGGGETAITAHDPKSDDHAFAIARPPLHGDARVRDDGHLRVCMNAGFVGRDTVVVTVTDRGDPARSLDVKIPIRTAAGAEPAACDLDAFAPPEGGGCDAARPPGWALAIVVLLVLRRRR